jgi:hypothetical protein
MKPERNKVLDDKAAAVLKAAEPFGRGDVMPTDAIEKACGELRYTKHWTSIVKKFRKRLLRERRIALLPVNGVGYRFCTHDEQIHETSNRRQRRAVRQLRQTLREVGAVPKGELTTFQAFNQYFRLEQVRAQAKSLRDSMRDQEAKAVTKTLPFYGDSTPKRKAEANGEPETAAAKG